MRYKNSEIRNKYSLIQLLGLCFDLLVTKVISRTARIIRAPIIIRGKRHIDFGHMLTTGVGCRFDAYSLSNSKSIKFGNNVQINDYVHICGMKDVSIGNNVLIASHVYISDNSHGIYKGTVDDSNPSVPPKDRDYFVEPTKIEDNVWIGEGCIIMPGVTIGEGCVIGAHSVVNRSIPPMSIAVGSPARVVKSYNIETKRWEKI